MTAAQKTAKDKFKKAIAYRQKTGVSLKEAFAHIYGKKVGAVKKKTAPKKKAAKKVVRKVVKKAAPKKIAKKKLTPRDYDKRYSALKPGKRVSENGNTYYESRPNRSDKGKLLGVDNSQMYVRISPIAYVYASKFLTKSTMGLRQWLQDNVGKFIEIDTSHLFNNQYNTKNSYRIYDTMIDAIKGDVRKKGKAYGISSEPEEIAFLDWGGIKPQILPNIPDKKFGSYQFESYPSLNYHRFRNARQTINFIYSNGKYYVSNGIGYKSHNKIASTYSGNTIPAKVKNDLDKYLKQYY
jgi:hypothetical protein